MEALLVIDVQMTEDGKHICDSCPVWDEKGCMCKYDFMFGHKGCPLKSMPMKREPKEEWLNEYRRDEFADGWNACLQEFTKSDAD